MRNPNENEGNILRGTTGERFTPMKKVVASEIVKDEQLTFPKVMNVEPVAVPIEQKDEVPVKEPPKSVPSEEKGAKKTT